jgi:hypothetical protein
MMMTSGPTNFEDSQLPEPGLESDPSVLTAYLSGISWGESYPEELLAISDTEQYILGKRQQGLRFIDMAEQEGVRADDLRDYYRAGAAKQELQASRAVDIHDLGTDAQRVLILNDIFGAGWEEKNHDIIQRDSSDLINYVGFMDSNFGVGWRQHDRLWSLGADGVQAKIEVYDRHLDPDWKAVPALVGVSVRTVLSSARALRYLGITRESTSKHAYYNLLKTRLATKQKRIIYIRRSILRHTQIRHSSQKRSISTLGARKAQQTEEERQTEQRELEELREFLTAMGAKCLLSSNRAITIKAYNKGLYKEPDESS